MNKKILAIIMSIFLIGVAIAGDVGLITRPDITKDLPSNIKTWAATEFGDDSHIYNCPDKKDIINDRLVCDIWIGKGENQLYIKNAIISNQFSRDRRRCTIQLDKEGDGTEVCELLTIDEMIDEYVTKLMKTKYQMSKDVVGGVNVTKEWS